MAVQPGQWYSTVSVMGRFFLVRIKAMNVLTMSYRLAFENMQINALTSFYNLMTEGGSNGCSTGKKEGEL